MIKYYPEFYNNFNNFYYDLNTGDVNYFTSKKITNLIEEFEIELRKNDFKMVDFLLKRNLYNEGLCGIIEKFLHKNQNFWIVKLPNIKVNVILDQEKIEQKFIAIPELNSDSNIIEADPIDEIILEELTNPTQYSDFIKKMSLYLDSNEINLENNFHKLLNNRLIDFVVKKVISIYQ